MNSFTAYIAIGAIIAGLALGEKSERCGAWQDADIVEVAAFAVIWPGMFAAVMFYDFDAPKSKCDEVKK